MSAHRILRDLFLEHNHADIPDPGASGSITVDRQLGRVAIVSAAAEARTLPNPERSGLVLLVYLKTDGGDVTLTVTDGFDAAANTTLVFDDAGDAALFVSVESGDNKRWRLVGYSGVPAPNQAAALTEQDTTITHTAAGTPDFAIQDLTDTGGFGFVTADEGNTVLQVVANLQTRLAEVEAALEGAGIVAAN